VNFKDLLLSDVEDVFFSDEFSELADFEKFQTGVVVKDVPVDIRSGATSQQEYGAADLATISIPASKISKPERNDKFKTKSTVYAVESRISSDDGVYVVSVSYEERHNPK
jgi:hypothetical protein